MKNQISLSKQKPFQRKVIYLLTFISVIALLLIGCESNQPVEAEGSGDPLNSLDKGKPKFKITLSGENEVPFGDPDGSGTAKLTLRQKQGTIEYEINVTNILLPATAAHIHNAPAGVNGAVVVPLAAPDANGVSSGIVFNVSTELIKDMRANPSNYYVNVHNSEYPGGAVRGQLK